MIGLTSSSSVLRSVMLRHPSIMNKWNPRQYVVRTMSSVHTAQTTTSAEHLHYGNDPTKKIMDDILVNKSTPQQHSHGTWHGRSNNTNNNAKSVHSTIGTNVPPATDPRPTFPRNNTTTTQHRVRTHINSTATNPNGGYVMFPL
jgi:hypothetical protein